MSEPTLSQKVLQAAATLEELQQDPVTNSLAYSPQMLRGIVNMWSGRNER